ncbi:MAG TPA: hypothetical protein VHO29_16670, partial [Marmoricola sp.]|nr:hypothetical protein [Marmoricola sp.]
MSGPEFFGPAGTSASEVPPLGVNPAAPAVRDATVIEHPTSRTSLDPAVTLGGTEQAEPNQETVTVTTAEETEVVLGP